MNRFLSRAIMRGLLLASFTLAGLGGCGGDGQHVMPPVETTAPVGQPAADPRAPERNTLTASLPALAQLAPGSEFDYVLSTELTEELYQMSGRIGFDPAVVRPVGVTYGSLLPADAVRMSRDDLPDIVPFAFTAQPGRSGIGAGRGELLRVRFQLVGTPADGSAVWLINEAEYLQLRDRIGRRLSFDLAREVGQ